MTHTNEALRLAREALEQSRDDVTNTLNGYVDHPANERKRGLVIAQLAEHDAAIAAIDAALAQAPSAQADPIAWVIRGTVALGNEGDVLSLACQGARPSSDPRWEPLVLAAPSLPEPSAAHQAEQAGAGEAAEIIRAEPWLKPAEVRDRLEGSE
jgi:hypothetical protein